MLRFSAFLGFLCNLLRRADFYFGQWVWLSAKMVMGLMEIDKVELVVEEEVFLHKIIQSCSR
jgi:hypothetical protein